MSDKNESAQTGWTKLYHPSGALVTLPLHYDRDDIDTYTHMFSAVGRAIAAGFTVAAPGLEAGEEKEEIGYVVRRSKDNADGSSTPVIDLYPANDAAHFAVLTVYLNRMEDVAAFQQASGLLLDKLPLYIGDNKIERGKKRELDKLVTKSPRPFGVVLIQNPKYDEAEANAARAAGKIYGVPKRRFVRWDGLGLSREENGASDAPKGTESTAVDQAVLAEWKKMLALEPAADVLTAGLKSMNNITSKHTWRAVWNAVMAYADNAGFEWDQNNKRFVPPVDVPQEADQEIPF